MTNFLLAAASILTRLVDLAILSSRSEFCIMIMITIRINIIITIIILTCFITMYQLYLIMDSDSSRIPLPIKLWRKSAFCCWLLYISA